MLNVAQSFDFPAVYFDHWAIRRFSTNQRDAQRFERALKASRGALVLSHTNLAEVTGPEDPRHAEEIAAFLESLLPNIYFAMFNLQLAIDQEQKPRDTTARLLAPPDVDLLWTVGRERPDDFQAFTIKNIIRVIAAHRERLNKTWLESNRQLAEHINRVRLDPLPLSQAKSFSGHPAHIPSKAVLQELVRPLFLDKTSPFDRNDAGDLHHAILSIVYCDYALLDGRWAGMHEQMKRRFAELGLPIRTAAVFSERHQGVERFLDALEAAKPVGRVHDDFPDTRT